MKISVSAMRSNNAITAYVISKTPGTLSPIISDHGRRLPQIHGSLSHKPYVPRDKIKVLKHMFNYIASNPFLAKVWKFL